MKSLCVVLSVVAVTASFLTTGSDAFGFYLPYLDPTDHDGGDEIPIMANSLRSLQSLVPYDYYRGPFCLPPVIETQSPSLGSIITGEKLKTSPYSVTMLRNETCKMVACSPQDLSKPRENIKELTRLIEDGYRGFLSLENLPMFNDLGTILGGSCVEDIPVEQRLEHMRGYALGVHHNCVGKTLVNNHIHFVAHYHTVEIAGKTSYRVVGFKGVPYSINYEKSKMACDGEFNTDRKGIVALTVDAMAQPDHQPKWTYAITWIERTDVFWATRWDEFLSTSTADTNSRIHWNYIAITILLNIIISTAAFTVLRRTLLKDFARYAIRDAEDQQEEVGWKLVHADVFRPPQHAKLLCAAAGNGMQLLGMIISVLFFSLLGFLSPANRGMLLSCIIFMYVVMAVLGGYTCGKLMKMFDQKEWKYVLLCGGGLPGAGFVCYTFINILNWHAGASDAIPFLWLVALFVLWAVVNIPVTFVGAMFAFNQPAVEPVTKIGRLAREIPAQRYYHSTPFIYIIPPLIPIGCVSMEMFFIFRSLWLGRVYYAFGFLTLVLILWAINIILTSVVIVYFRLTYENHRWWWSSFLVPGCMGAHFFAFSLYYFFSELHIKGATGVLLYLFFCAFVSLMYGLVSGTIGFVSSLIFTRKIYSSIRID